MRVIGGTLGGRRFEPPAKGPARPTTDRAREGLFNILEHSFALEGKRVLDLFAGSGGVSYEALSRGANAVVAVEKHREMARFIKKTATAFGVSAQLAVHTADVLKYLNTTPDGFDFVFADPPYELPGLEKLPNLILEGSVLQPGGLFVLEHRSKKNNFEDHPSFFREAVYGEATFAFFTRAAS